MRAVSLDRALPRAAHCYTPPLRFFSLFHLHLYVSHFSVWRHHVPVQRAGCCALLSKRKEAFTVVVLGLHRRSVARARFFASLLVCQHLFAELVFFELASKSSCKRLTKLKKTLWEWGPYSKRENFLVPPANTDVGVTVPKASTTS